jgi:hypothetical protein
MSGRSIHGSTENLPASTYPSSPAVRRRRKSALASRVKFMTSPLGLRCDGEYPLPSDSASSCQSRL